MRVPLRLADGGLVVIDATWALRPMQLADGVCTVGELEVSLRSLQSTRDPAATQLPRSRPRSDPERRRP